MLRARRPAGWFLVGMGVIVLASRGKAIQCGVMMTHSWMDMVFSLAATLSAGLMVVGGVVAVMALRNIGSIVLLIGAVLGLLNSLGWMVLPLLMRTGSFDAGEGFFTVMRIFGTFSWLLTAVGVVLLALAASGLRRRVWALESTMAGSQTDRVA